MANPLEAPALEKPPMHKSAEAFRTISEVSEDLDVPQHVLRFWETKFSQVKPLKRAGGRRYYRPEDVALLRRIRSLLHGEGYTIKGVQRLLRDRQARDARPAVKTTAAEKGVHAPAALARSEHSGPLQAEPEQAGFEPARLEPARLEPAGLEPARLEPARLEPSQAESSGAEARGNSPDHIRREMEAALGELKSLRALLASRRR